MFGNIFRGPRPKEEIEKKSVEPRKKFLHVLVKKERKENESSGELEYYRHDGAAHVGEDLPKMMQEEVAIEEPERKLKEEEIHSDLEKKFKAKSRRMKPLKYFNSAPTTTREKEENAHPVEIKNDGRKGFHGSEEINVPKRVVTNRFPKDNLKTLNKQKSKEPKENPDGIATISKIARQNRGKIRKVLHNPEDFLK
ncbi:MAG TPA: hypothetical protein PLO44_01150 [Candidatus Paceibacterota bacterium]|nr:hypothetical protein [Candidatus Paceibacterota bacterium]